MVATSYLVLGDAGRVRMGGLRTDTTPTEGSRAQSLGCPCQAASVPVEVRNLMMCGEFLDLYLFIMSLYHSIVRIK